MRKKLTFLCFILIITSGTIVSAQEATPSPVDPSTYKIETVVEHPLITSIVWGSDGRLFWTEKGGIVGTISPDGTIQDSPVLALSVQTAGEEGILSMALDPKFDENHYFYVFYTMPPTLMNEAPGDVIYRFEYDNGIGKNPVQLFRIDIPKGQDNQYKDLHNGGRMKFGPKDGDFYVSIGDLGLKAAGQDFNVLSGKIHRFIISNNTLIPAPGNPFPGNSTWITGVRNTFAFIFDPLTDLIFATENGPECDDEINLIIPGQNYGWTKDINCNMPLAQRQAAGIPPLVSWTPTIAPTGIMLYDGDAFPNWKGKLFYCAWNTEQMNYFELNDKHTKFVAGPVSIPLPKDKKCSVELAQGPDGYIYYSNITGMYRLVPATN